MKRKLLVFYFLLVAVAIQAQTVYVTKSGKKYHEENCRYLSNTSYSLNLVEATEKGYTACSICKPTLTQTETNSVKSLYSNNSSKSNSSGSTSQSYDYTKSSTSVQCSGRTKKGTRCQRMTKSSNGYCYQHGG